MREEFHCQQRHHRKQVVVGDGIAGALEVVVVLGVVLVVEMWVLELKCSDGYLVGVVFW